MAISENDRLDLRQALERVLDERLAAIAMEAMPPLDYEQFATKADLENLEIRLSSRIDGLESSMHREIHQFRGDLFAAMNSQFRLLIGMQLAMFLGLGTWITAVT